MVVAMNQVITTEDAGMDDVVALAVDSVNAEDAGKEEGTVTAPVEDVVDSGVSEVIDTRDETTEENEKSVKSEDAEEDAKLEDIMAEDKPKSDTEKAKAGTPDWLQKKIDKQTRQNKEALEAKEQEIAELKARVIPDKRPPVPLPEDFVTTEEYQVAFQEHLDKDAEWKEANKGKIASEAAAAQRSKDNIARFMDGAERMKEKYADFDQIVNKDTEYGHLSDFILSTDFPEAISYHLGKNPQKLDALLRLDPVSAAIAIGELSAKCRSSKTKTLSTAPAVLNKVKDSESGGSSEGISLAEIEKISREVARTY